MYGGRCQQAGRLGYKEGHEYLSSGIDITHKQFDRMIELANCNGGLKHVFERWGDDDELLVETNDFVPLLIDKNGKARECDDYLDWEGDETFITLNMRLEKYAIEDIEIYAHGCMNDAQMKAMAKEMVGSPDCEGYLRNIGIVNLRFKKCEDCVCIENDDGEELIKIKGDGTVSPCECTLKRIRAEEEKLLREFMEATQCPSGS